MPTNPTAKPPIASHDLFLNPNCTTSPLASDTEPFLSLDPERLPLVRSVETLHFKHESTSLGSKLGLNLDLRLYCHFLRSIGALRTLNLCASDAKDKLCTSGSDVRGHDKTTISDQLRMRTTKTDTSLVDPATPDWKLSPSAIPPGLCSSHSLKGRGGVSTVVCAIKWNRYLDPPAESTRRSEQSRPT